MEAGRDTQARTGDGLQVLPLGGAAGIMTFSRFPSLNLSWCMGENGVACLVVNALPHHEDPQRSWLGSIVIFPPLALWCQSLAENERAPRVRLHSWQPVPHHFPRLRARQSQHR